MSTKETIHSYYNGIEQKSGWQSAIASDIHFNSPGQVTVGKEAYIASTSRFLSVVKGSRIIELIIQENKACVLVNYELLSAKGNHLNCVVAEILEVENGKINSSSIFFDTAAFRSFMTEG